jgi:hypothetical protein
VSLKQVWNIPGPDGHSETVMDHIVKLFLITHKKRVLLLRRINACRVYLRVLWVSDLLLDPDDTVMDTDIINGRKINNRSSLQYPYQGRPSQRDFELWKDCMYKCFYTICPASTATDGVVVRSIFGQTQVHDNNFTEHSDYEDIARAISKYPTLLGKFKNLPLRFRDIVGDIQVPSDNGYSLLCCLKNDNAVFASDGSYYEDMNKGTHAYILASKDSDLGQIKGAAVSPHSDHMSSAPTEHYGALAVLLTVAVLLYHYNEDGLGWPAVKCYIDNEEVVNRSNLPYPKFRNVQQYLVHNYDLWLLTSHILSSIKLHVEFKWVRGHQTAEENNDNIMATLLNIEVDKMATEQYTKCKSIPHRGAFHSGKVCYHQKGFHVQKIQNAIMARESDANLLTYYKQHGWSENSLELVDWRQIEKFLWRRHPIERCNIIQLMHDWQHMGSQQMKFESR